MPEETRISEDSGYKPSSPEKPARKFFIETEGYRWEVYVWRYSIKETGTTIYRAEASEGYTSYGVTVNEALNDLKSIMQKKLAACEDRVKIVSLDSVRSYLDPVDAAKEDLRIAKTHASKPLLARLLGL